LRVRNVRTGLLMDRLRLLVVEDEVKLLGNICRGLQEQNFSVVAAGTAQSAEHALRTTDFDVIVLDLRLPDKDGLDFLRDFRGTANQTPVLILTARGAVSERVAGLDCGADDYLAKPFAFAELVARIRAIARRRLISERAILRASGLEFDLVTRRVYRAGRELYLSPKETLLLELLMRNAGQTITRTMITEILWGANYNEFSNLLEVFVNRLRHKLDEAGAPSLITTVRGIGYLIRKHQ
jgi:two-component system, OmpR family, copper resistance phosphate regulon response regulator CusR